jgi:hypothetical protein
VILQDIQDRCRESWRTVADAGGLSKARLAITAVVLEGRAKDVLEEFRAAMHEHGIPASTLTDNGMVFTTRLSGGR